MRIKCIHFRDRTIYRMFFMDQKLSKVHSFKRMPHSPATSIRTGNIEYDVTEEVIFSGDGDYINTGVNLFEKGHDWSMLIDFTDEGKSEPYNSLFILHNLHEENNDLYGFNIQKTGDAQGNRLGFQVNTNWYSTKPLVAGVNTRLVVTFRYPDKLDMYYNDPELDAAFGSVGHVKFDYSGYRPIEAGALHLACWYNKDQGGVGRFWRGQINEFVIWNRVALNDEEIQIVLNNKKYE